MAWGYREAEKLCNDALKKTEKIFGQEHKEAASCQVCVHEIQKKRGSIMGIVVKSFDIGQGDFFLIKVSGAKGKYFNLMVDCGKKDKLEQLEIALGGQSLNGIVVTHVDNDHIVGVIDLVENYDFLNNAFIIYNKYDETLITYDKGNKLYEEIKRKLSEKMLLKSYARNYSRENKAIERRRKKDELPVHILSKVQRALMREDMLEEERVYITLLSPDIDVLKRLMRDWKKVAEKRYGTKENSELKNKSSISFLLEFNRKRVLMTGDGELKEIYEVLKGFKGLETIDYIKLSHHGAKNNNAGIEEFVDTYGCKKYGVTIKERQNGEMKHPARDVIEELVDLGCHIYTSTDYICVDSEDLVHKIEKQSEVDV